MTPPSFTVIADPPVIRSATALLREQRIPMSGARVVACCSGGADSVALVDVVASLPYGLRPAGVTVLFLDHGLRDVTADRETARAIAERHRLTWTERTAPVGIFARNLQASARAWRLQEALTVAGDVGATLIATGHHADDTLETLLMGLAGSSGPLALRGIPAFRELQTDPSAVLVRPLSRSTRAELRTHLTERGIGWTEDPSNADPDSSRRNAVRHELLPALLERFPGAAANLERSRVTLAELADGADALADAVLAGAEGEEPGSLRLEPLRALAPAAQRILVARWLRGHGLGRSVSARTIGAVVDLIDGPQPNGARMLQLRNACVKADRYSLRIASAPSDLEDR